MSETSGCAPLPSPAAAAIHSAAVVLPCSFCTATFTFEANLSQHVSRFHADAVAFDTTLPDPTAGSAPIQGSLPAAGDAGADSGAATAHPVHGDDDGRRQAEEELVDAGTTAVVNTGGGSMPILGTSRSPSLRRVRHVFQGTTSALVYRYFVDKGDIGRAEPLVPLCRQGRPSKFVSDELKAIRLFALSTGGRGLSEKARVEFYNSVAQAEVVTAAAAKMAVSELGEQLYTSSYSAGSSTSGSGSSSASNGRSSTTSTPSRPAKKVSLRTRLRKAIATANAKASNIKGPLTSAFPTAAAFVSSLKGEQDRCLSEMKWQVTDIIDNVPFKFFFRDIMDVAHDAFGRADKVQLRGTRPLDANGDILRSNSLDSDVYLVQEADVLRIHANAVDKGKPIKAFAMAVQFFSDATLLSWNGGEWVEHFPCNPSALVCV